MASNLFKSALAATKQSKNLDTILVGGDFLSDGTYDVTIQAIDSSDIENNKLNVTYVTEGGKIFRDKIFLTNLDGTELSFSIRQILSATIPNKDAFAAILDLADSDDHAFETLTGMKLRITLRPGKGVQVRAVSNGLFVGHLLDNKGKDQGPVTEEFENIADAKDAAKAAGYKLSYQQVSKAEATNAEDNIAAFKTALAGKGVALKVV